jgi:hypothetical protein
MKSPQSVLKVSPGFKVRVEAVAKAREALSDWMSNKDSFFVIHLRMVHHRGRSIGGDGYFE